MIVMITNKTIGRSPSKNNLKITFDSKKNFNSVSSKNQSKESRTSVDPPKSLIGTERVVSAVGKSFVIEVDTVINCK